MSDEEWDKNFAKLDTFKKKNGHSKVPKHYSEDMRLALWVTEQRRVYKLYTSMGTDEERATVPLKPEQFKKLEEFEFELSNKNPRHLRWNFRYEQLKEFLERVGHTQVPIGWEENVKLANWVSTQRQEYKNIRKGRTSQLNDQRIQLLTDIGFAWEVQRGGRRRKLSPAVLPDTEKTQNENDQICILPGVHLAGGPLENTTGRGPPSKKTKRSTGDQGPTPSQLSMQQHQHMQHQQYQHHHHQQMLGYHQQQQRLAAASGSGQGMWQRPGQQGLPAAPPMHAPGWRPMHAFHGHGAVQPGYAPGMHGVTQHQMDGMAETTGPSADMMQQYPMAVASTPLQMALANSNRRSKSDPPISNHLNRVNVPPPREQVQLSSRRKRSDPPSDPPEDEYFSSSGSYS